MIQYKQLLREILFGTNSYKKDDRTGTGTIGIFGWQSKYDLRKGFPLITTKKLHTRSIVHELLWFLKGDTNIKYLKDNGVSIWDEWADENGDLGPVYGKQWRNWETKDPHVGHIDQISNLIESIKTNPNSRRLIVSAWNPEDVDKMALPPCHTMFQINCVEESKEMDLQLYQRSADVFLGVPFNIASYSLLLHMIAKVTGYTPRYFIHTLGDAHLYSNHIDQAREQLRRIERELPTLRLADRSDLFDFTYEDIEFLNYNPHPTIKAKVSV